MVEAFIAFICGFISDLLHAVWRAFVPLEEPDSSLKELMEELSPRQLAAKQLKQQFLEALKANDAEQVLQILTKGKLDIHTVLEVEDPDMILASYKQGKEQINW